MFSKYVALAPIALLASFSSVHAQEISISNGALALDGSNILDAGPVVYAYNLDGGGSGATTTVGGVTFVGTATYSGDGPGPMAGPDFSIAGGGFDGTGGSGTPGVHLTTQAVAPLNNEGVYNVNTFSLHNLTVGDTYYLQLVIDAQPPDNRQVDFTDVTGGNVSSGTITSGAAGPQYIDESFKATAASEDFTVGGFGPQGRAQLSGFVLETPEPSTYAMMLAGLALLGFCVRRKLA